MDELNRSRGRYRWFFRFSIASLLLGMAVVAGYFTGYRFGERQAIQDVADTKVTSVVYQVKDLIKPLDAPQAWSPTEQDFEPLVELITSTIASNEWSTPAAGITPFVANKSLVVSCSGVAHRELAELLHQLRTLRYKLPEDYLAKVRELAGRQKPTRRVIKALTDDSPDRHTIMKNHYDSALQELAAAFGAPTQVASAGEAQYPEWIGAQHIAVWDRGVGKLYFALVDCRPHGEALVAGWWEETVGQLKPIELAVKN